MNGLVINLTHSVDDVDRTSVAIVVAGASVASSQKTTVFLSSEGTRLAAKGVAETLHEEGFAPMSELVASYVEAGGTFLVCSPCAKKRGIGEDDVIEGASIVGGATLVALLADALGRSHSEKAPDAGSRRVPTRRSTRRSRCPGVRRRRHGLRQWPAARHHLSHATHRGR